MTMLSHRMVTHLALCGLLPIAGDWTDVDFADLKQCVQCSGPYNHASMSCFCAEAGQGL